MSKVPTSDISSRNWCFTLNNYTDDDESWIQASCDEYSCVIYCIYGREIGKSGTPHLQGYIQFNKSRKRSWIKSKFINNNRVHCEPAHGSAQSNIDYCSKEDNHPFIHGTPNLNAGLTGKEAGQCRWKTLKETIDNGATYDDLLDTHTSQAIMYAKALKDIIKTRDLKKCKENANTIYKNAKMYQWQCDAINHLLKQNERTVLWYVDYNGNTGKSWLAGYLEDRGAFVITSGKSSDIAYAYHMEPVVVFDFTRDKKDTINYSIIEAFKNGRLFNSKYESNVLRFPPTKVIAFSNWEPDMTKLSQDRWDIKYLNYNSTNIGRKKPPLLSAKDWEFLYARKTNAPIIETPVTKTPELTPEPEPRLRTILDFDLPHLSSMLDEECKDDQL